MPVGGCPMRPDCGRELAKTFRRKAQVFQLIDIVCVILYLCVKWALAIK